MSDSHPHPPAAALAPAIRAVGVSVAFLIRYHRTEVTLRELFVDTLDRLRPRRGGNGTKDKQFWALRDIDVEVLPGEVVGLVGRNGSGKTTLLKTLAGILGPDTGHVDVRGRVGCLMSFGVGFRPNLSGRENVFINGSILGMSRREIEQRMGEIVAFSELEEFIDAPVRTYSAGMRGRLGFSIAIHIDPDVLLLDEVLSVGDASFREKSGSILDRFRAANKTVIIASHSMKLIQERCTRALWLDKGRIRLDGTPEAVVSAYAGKAGGSDD